MYIGNWLCNANATQSLSANAIVSSAAIQTNTDGVLSHEAYQQGQQKSEVSKKQITWLDYLRRC
jgi:hypothetical protein